MTRPELTWPFYPRNLSDLFDDETLSVMLNGCCERLGAPLSILDLNLETKRFSERIDPIKPRQNYTTFCHYLRSDEKGDLDCKLWDQQQAGTSLAHFHTTGEEYREFNCRCELRDMTVVISIHRQAIAMIFSGQFLSDAGKPAISLALPQHLPGSNPDRIRQLDYLADDLVIVPSDFKDRLIREAQFIHRFTLSEYEQKKREKEQTFLNQLRPAATGPAVNDRVALAQQTRDMLAKVAAFCGCDYLAFFGSKHDGDTLLNLLACSGLPDDSTINQSHFNWRKGGLAGDSIPSQWTDLLAWSRQTGIQGIRGAGQQSFINAALLLPIAHGDNYLGLLVFGPFHNPAVELEDEQHFLSEISRVIGFYSLTGLQVLHLQQERRRWQSTAMLLGHQLKTVLTPISINLGRAIGMLENPRGGVDTNRLRDFIHKAEDQAMTMAKSATRTIKGHALLLNHSDMDFEIHPLSVLVGNCATGFVEKAASGNKELLVDSSIEMLPDAEVDIARLTIAISNLLDNAIKYSFARTRINVRGHVVLTSGGSYTAEIEIDDLGYEIAPHEKEMIFNLGTRGTTALQLARIPGTGMGLWEAHTILVAHRGDIKLRSEPTLMARTEGQAWRVIFTIILPLRQKKK